MNEERSESRASMSWFDLLFKNVINVNKEFFKSFQSSHDQYNLLLESNIHIPDPMFCNNTEEQKFHLFLGFFFHLFLFFAASCITWRRHEPAYHHSSKWATLVLWSGATSWHMRCVLHSAPFIFQLCTSFLPNGGAPKTQQGPILFLSETAGLCGVVTHFHTVHTYTVVATSKFHPQRAILCQHV